MKTLRTLLAVAALTFVFSHAAFADDGIIHGDAPSAATTSGDATATPAATDDGAALTDAAVALVRDALGEMLALA